MLQAGTADKAVALLRKVASGPTIDPRREALLIQAVAVAEGLPPVVPKFKPC